MLLIQHQRREATRRAASQWFVGDVLPRKVSHAKKENAALANARARVSKLEAAIAAVGDSDAISVTLKEALSRAKSQVQQRPVADRIKTHEHLHREGEEEGRFVPARRDERPGGRGAGTGEAGKGRSVAARRRSPFTVHEESNQMECQDVPPTVPCIFASELAQLRACVAEL